MYTNEGKFIEIDRSNLIGSGCYGNVYLNNDKCYKIFKTKDEFERDPIYFMETWDDTIVNLIRTNKYPNMVNVHNTLYDLPNHLKGKTLEELIRLGIYTSEYYRGYSMDYLKQSNINPLLDKNYFIKNYVDLLELVRKLAYDKIRLLDCSFDNSVVTDEGIKIIDFDMFTIDKEIGYPLHNNIDEFSKYIGTLVMYYLVKLYPFLKENAYNTIFVPTANYVYSYYYEIPYMLEDMDKPLDLIKQVIK